MSRKKFNLTLSTRLFFIDLTKQWPRIEGALCVLNLDAHQEDTKWKQWLHTRCFLLLHTWWCGLSWCLVPCNALVIVAAIAVNSCVCLFSTVHFQMYPQISPLGIFEWLHLLTGKIGKIVDIQGGLGGLYPDAFSHAMPSSLSLLLVSTPPGKKDQTSFLLDMQFIH